MSFRIESVPLELAREARRTMRSPQYGHPAHREVAKGYGPCRVCLRAFVRGAEDRLLFTFNPFADASCTPAPGPVFVHAEECEPFEGASLPDHLLELPLLFEPVDAEGLPLARIRPAADAVEEEIGRLLGDDAVARIIVRNAEAGCFIAQVTRANAS